MIEHDPLFAQDQPRCEHDRDERERRQQERDHAVAQVELPQLGKHDAEQVANRVAEEAEDRVRAPPAQGRRSTASRNLHAVILTLHATAFAGTLVR